MINNENPVSCLTVDQLNAIWGPDSKISNWNEIPGLKEEFDEELALFGPGTDSGTFDYFTDEINGEEGATRKDYNNVGENDNATVTGVEGSPGGMGYAGFSFYTENEGKLKALEVDGGKGCVGPSVETRSGRHLHAAQQAAVHLPERQRAEEARGQGVRRLLPRKRHRRRRIGRLHPADRRAARRVGNRREEGRRLAESRWLEPEQAECRSRRGDPPAGSRRPASATARRRSRACSPSAASSRS